MKPASPNRTLMILAGGLLLGCGMGGVAFGLVVWPELTKARPASDATYSMNRMKNLALGFSLYAAEYQDTLPPAMNWNSSVMPYVDPEDFVFPGEKKGPYSFAMNEKAGGVNIVTVREPATTPMLFESQLSGPGAIGGRDELPDSPPFGGSIGIGFIDGRVSRMPLVQAKGLNWDWQGQNSPKSSR